MRGLTLFAFGLAAAAVAGCAPRDAGPAREPGPALIPRTALLSEPVQHSALISPRGDRIAYLAVADGETRIWVAAVGAMAQARPLAGDLARGVRSFQWSGDGSHILFLRGQGDDGAGRLYAADLASNAIVDLTPTDGVRPRILSVTASEPDIVLVGLNDRDPAWHDVYRINVRTGARDLVLRNTRGFSALFADRQNEIRLGVAPRADGGMTYWVRDANRWRALLEVGFEAASSTWPIGFEADGRSVLMYDALERDRAALSRLNVETGERTVLGESPRADVVDVWIDPATQSADAFGAEYLRREWRALSAEAQADITFLDAQLRGDLIVRNRSLDDTRWIVDEVAPQTPGATWLYDRGDPQNRTLTLLFRQRPALEGAALQPMIPLEIPARDGQTLVSYLTLPAESDADANGRPDRPVPMALIVHGGPWARESYGFNPTHQWLANRGYAVLTVNYRGSTGFGVAFLNAGNQEWGGVMQDDLYDAAQWAIDENIAPPDRIAILGQSYGGYAALAALTFSPGRFACGVSLSGPSNLQSVLTAPPSYWAPYRAELVRRVGDPETAAGRARLRRASPYLTASSIRDPLLIGQGGRDARVPRADSDRIAQTLVARGRPFAYVLFPDEGHMLVKPQNRLAFAAVTENFLARCLGGRAEPVGRAFEGSSLQALAGGDLVPALSARARPLPRAASTVRRASSSDEPVQEIETPDFVPPPPDLPIATAPQRALRPPEDEAAAPASDARVE